MVGFGRILQAVPFLLDIFRYGGATFLLFYSFRSAQSAWRGGGTLRAEGKVESFVRVVSSSLAMTWLNPHVYLDTVVLIGSISQQFSGNEKFLFGVGASLSSFIFFFSLAYGAKLIVPYMKNTSSWRILDFSVAIIMFIISFNLLGQISI